MRDTALVLALLAFVITVGGKIYHVIKTKRKYGVYILTKE